MIRAEDYRFARVTSNDRSAILWIVTLLALVYATLILGVRLGYTKWRAYGSDDVIVVLAYVQIPRSIASSSRNDMADRPIDCRIWHVGCTAAVPRTRSWEIIQSS